jgi:hypothetical protein
MPDCILPRLKGRRNTSLFFLLDCFEVLIVNRYGVRLFRLTMELTNGRGKLRNFWKWTKKLLKMKKWKILYRTTADQARGSRQAEDFVYSKCVSFKNTLEFRFLGHLSIFSILILHPTLFEKWSRCCWQMDVCIFSVLSKRTIAQIGLLFFHLLFRSWESFSVAGEWPNLRLVLRLAYLRVYILNSLPYLELLRNIIAPEGFLENVPWHSLCKRWGSPSDANHTQISWLYKEMSNPRDGWQ